MGKKRFRRKFIHCIKEDEMHHSAMDTEQNATADKVDPYIAAGIAFGIGKLNSFEDQMHLAAYLGALGAFDRDETPD